MSTVTQAWILRDDGCCRVPGGGSKSSAVEAQAKGLSSLTESAKPITAEEHAARSPSCNR